MSRRSDLLQFRSNADDFGGRLAKRMLERGKNIESFSNDLDVTKNTLYKWIKMSEADSIQVSDLRKLSEKLDCDMSYLLGESKTEHLRNEKTSEDLSLTDAALETIRKSVESSLGKNVINHILERWISGGLAHDFVNYVYDLFQPANFYFADLESIQMVRKAETINDLFSILDELREEENPHIKIEFSDNKLE